MTLEVHTTELRAKDALSPVLKQVGTAAREAAGTITKSFNDANESQRRFNIDRAALVGGLRELQGVASDFARSAAEEAAGQERLQVAIENTGRSYDQISAKVDTLVKRGVELSFADDQVVEALTRLTTTTGNADTAMADLGLAMDLARARHIDLATAADIVGKVATGNTGILARYGIAVQDGATANEALLAIQQRVTGQSAAYATTVEGTATRISNAVADFGENLFGQNEQLQLFLTLMPGVSAAYSTLAGILAGIGGIGAAAAIAGPLALLAGSGAYAYNLNTSQGGWAENLTTSALAGTAGALNWALPGDPFSGVQQQFLDLKKKGNFESALNSVYMNIPGNNVKQDENYWIGVLITSGVLPVGWSGSMTDAADYISKHATATGVSNQQYVTGKLNTSGTYTYDPVSQSYVPSGYVPTLKANRYFELGGNLTSGATTMGYGALANQAGMANNPYGSGTANLPPGLTMSNAYQRGGSGAVANDLYNLPSNRGPVQLTPDQQAAQRHVEIANALGEEYKAYIGLVEGINSASDAQKAYKATQDGLIAAQQPYSQQIGEYNSQLSAESSAYDILTKRKADGIALTQQETDFLNNHTRAQERGTAGVEDATVAQGMLAQQYLLNMEKGDAMNAALMDQTGAVGDLVRIIQDLILSMDGIPPEVRSRIEINRAEESRSLLQNIADYLNGIDGRSVSFTVNAQGNGLALGNPNGPSIDPGEGYRMLGGMVGAAHGRMLGRGYTLVGEDQPELLVGGRGGMVIPGSATRAMRRGSGGGGDTIHINAPITVIANDPRQFGNALRENAVGASR